MRERKNNPQPSRACEVQRLFLRVDRLGSRDICLEAFYFYYI
nr:MAG TPA: hypothetical protein [Myoviridae sp. ctPCN11]